ncbi:dipeptidyl aminopeptidase [Ophiocordyceps camponoti-floridani]|uniref:Probable dipeptidyl-aminopeptidase B n=1 Tax=Ophiocordyceps camponoti-floridani TaxID=2030778 RepID=A0A8H4Q376_9HYPO|nr:dipeptidyl aminopeptidase [Ophiocordyceps camponoti-floridani]
MSQLIKFERGVEAPLSWISPRWLANPFRTRWTPTLQEESDKPIGTRQTTSHGTRKTTSIAQPNEADDEAGPFLASSASDGSRRRSIMPMDRRLRRGIIGVVAIIVALWLVALAVFVSGSYKNVAVGGDKNVAVNGDNRSMSPDMALSGSGRVGKPPVSLQDILTKYWTPKSRPISWISGPEGKDARDGLLLEEKVEGQDFLVVKDVRAKVEATVHLADAPRTLMKSEFFEYNGSRYAAQSVTPSPDLTKVLIAVDKVKLWRHSSVAVYFILHVASGRVVPLVPHDAGAHVQLAVWNPNSDALSFTLDNDIYIRNNDSHAERITSDGGPDYFYGVPDWVYEEEVLSGRTASWWSDDGRYVAFLRTNETAVQQYPIEYYISRPSGKIPEPGLGGYPDTRYIKYPKPGSPNPIVDILFYDTVAKGAPFSIPAPDGFPDADRIVAYLLWAGKGRVLVKQTNRVGNHQRTLLIDVANKTARVVYDVNATRLDGGWIDVASKAVFVPADEKKARPHDGYIDTVIHKGYNHLAYFSPLDSPEPSVMLTSGDWEVVDAPEAVDLDKNLVYFVAARESSTQRHVYSVKLTGSEMDPLTPIDEAAYYQASFSSRAGFALLSNQGPGVPVQRLVSTASAPPDAKFPASGLVVEDNAELASRVESHALPRINRGVMDIGGGISLNYVERLPVDLDRSVQHPVLFHQYSGPGSQSVDYRFAVDFQTYVASSLGYIVVTVDARGTGFRGRAHRNVVYSQLGLVEASDHALFAAAYARNNKHVDPSRLAIWGWSYGGFQTLKTLEQDAGKTFSYGLAVAPVTDWRLYDSIYTERYMLTPQMNAAGYDSSAVANASALGENVRFLVMHGTADDNVHFQNSLRLLDKLNLAGVRNYDVHVFPDSDHSISFDGATRMVHDRLSTWLQSAFSGKFLDKRKGE